jgi:acyl-CoA reductase-like NAD-dependent aldehyde dehydrogenase
MSRVPLWRGTLSAAIINPPTEVTSQAKTTQGDNDVRDSHHQSQTSRTDSPSSAERSRDEVGRARAAVEAAARAFPAWAATPPRDRGVLLQRAAAVLMERLAEIAALVTEETCGTRFWGMFNVKLPAEILAYYAGQTDISVHDAEIPSHLAGNPPPY